MQAVNDTAKKKRLYSRIARKVRNHKKSDEQRENDAIRNIAQRFALADAGSDIRNTNYWACRPMGNL